MATIAIEEITAEASKLLASLGEGSMSPCAYDTAWVARLTRPEAPDEPLFPASFDWLLRNQHADGSWGAEIPFAHDRVISTLSALVALAGSQYRKDEAQRAARRGVVYLNRERPNLKDDPAETVGFELILPELVGQAKGLGLRLPYKDWEFVEAIKADKLRRIPPIAIYGGPTPMTHSLEFLGDRLAPMLVQRCQSPNGSYGASPSATAYVQARLQDGDAVKYLQQVTALTDDGGVVDVHPIDVFETAWVLNSLSDMKDELPEYDACVKKLAQYWTPYGVSFTSDAMVTDADDTAVAVVVLKSWGERVDTDVFELFESDEYFYCFPFERDQSASANAGILQALKLYESTPDRRRMILKVIHYLNKSRTTKQYWQDKWHASPFYATARAINALVGLDNNLVRSAIQWVLDEQHANGTWGFGNGTLEETGYALDALMAASSTDTPLAAVTRQSLERGTNYLTQRFDEEDYPSLWVGKGLYTPYCVVRAKLLGVLHRYYSQS